VSENLVLKLFENILPLLLSIIILLAIVYFLIHKITSPFSRFGDFLYRKYNRLSEAISQSRKDKLKKQIESQNIKLIDLENKYNRSAKSLIEIKDKLNDLSKYFTELNQCELQKDASRETVKKIDCEISAAKTDTKNI
jgi:septal ring factor EnvC (AmiA/AmiB activator)